MSLLSKLERLEKIATGKAAARFEPDPELSAAMATLLRDLTEREARPAPPIHEQIMELRADLKRRTVDDKTRDPADEEQMREMFGDDWNALNEWLIQDQTRQLAVLEAQAATP